MNVDTCARRALAGLTDQQRRDVAADPIDALRALGLEVRAVEHLANQRADGGACDGVSFLDDGVVLYAASSRSRRENFTLAHELGHWLVHRDSAILDWLADQPSPMAQLETICDRVAQQLLLPAEHVAATVGAGPVRAEHLLELYAGTNASRPVCAIGLAARLRGLGAVVIINTTTWDVESASIHPDPDRGWPEVFPWRGQPTPPGHPFRTLRPGAALTRRSRWTAPWGSEQTYYIDALRDDRRVYAVLADTDLWHAETLHLDPPRDYLDRPRGEVTCCGRTHTVSGYRCSTCDRHYCPVCKQCVCDRRAARAVTCTKCFLTREPHLVSGGVCVECRG